MYWGCKVPGLWKYLQLFLHAVDLPWICRGFFKPGGLFLPQIARIAADFYFMEVSSLREVFAADCAN